MRAYPRYLAPLTLLALVVFAPYLWLAFRTPVPADAAAVREIVKLAWLSLAYVVGAQLLLSGAATPMAMRDLSQLGALVAGARQLARAAVPCAIAFAAVIAGGLALALPGLALFVLFSLTATSEVIGLPGPLLDSALVVRRHWRRVLLTLLAIGLGDAALIYLVQHFAIGLPNKPADYAAVRRVVRLVAVGTAVVSPIAAAALAAIRASDTGRGAAPAPAAAPSAMSDSPPAALPRSRSD